MAQKAYLHLIKWAINKGFTIDVFDGEDTFKNCNYFQAKEAVEAVDEPTSIRLYEGGCYMGEGHVLLEFGQRSEETIFDYVITPTMEEWEIDYHRDNPDV